MEPDAPINEAARLNVSLSCEVAAGNPNYLKAVRWYLDGDLLKELPDCSRNSSAEEFCDIDPSKLLLESVGRSFHGNYSCEGRNEAGWGPISSNTPVVVYCMYLSHSFLVSRLPPRPVTFNGAQRGVVPRRNAALITGLLLRRAMPDYTARRGSGSIAIVLAVVARGFDRGSALGKFAVHCAGCCCKTLV